MHENFPPGTALCQATSSDLDIEVLASPVKMLLINKHDTAQTILVNGVSDTLPAYAVRFIATPALGDRPSKIGRVRRNRDK